jgi:hypothetical protein
MNTRADQARLGVYRDLSDMLERAILLTPTGPFRTQMTQLNIDVQGVVLGLPDFERHARDLQMHLEFEQARDMAHGLTAAADQAEQMKEEM